MKGRTIALISGLVLSNTACTPKDIEAIVGGINDGMESIAAASNGSVPEHVAKGSDVKVGQTIQGSLMEFGERDDFTFRGTKGQEIVVYAQADQSALDVRLLDASGFGQVAHTGVQPRRPLEQTHTRVATLPADDAYVIRLEGGHAFPNTYRFQIRALDRAPESISANVSLGDVISGEQLDAYGDIDEFTFTGRKGQRLVVYAQSEKIPMDLHVIGQFGNEIARLTPIQSRRPLEARHTKVITLPETGEYRLRIGTGYEASTSSAFPSGYRIELRVLN